MRIARAMDNRDDPHERIWHQSLIRTCSGPVI